MSTIKGPGGAGPTIPVAPQTNVAQVAKTAETAPTAAPSPKDQFGGEAATHPAMHAGTLSSAAPAGGSVLGGLALIASLRGHPLFGSGARIKPLKPGQTGIDGDLDAQLLATDLGAFFDDELLDAPEPKRAAIASLFASYPGGRDALGPITDALT